VIFTDGPIAGQGELRRVKIVLLGDYALLTAPRRTALVEALASLVLVQPQELTVLGVYSGSIVVDLAMPGRAADRLRALLVANDRRLTLLRVSEVYLARGRGQTEHWRSREGRFELLRTLYPPPDRPGPPVQLRLFGPVVVALMVGCLAWSLVALAELLAPEWNSRYLVVGAVLAALEANYSHRIVSVRRVSGTELFRFRAAELLLFLVLIRLARYAGQDWSAVWAEIQTWPHAPWNMVDLELMGAYGLLLSGWFVATSTAANLQELAEPPVRTPHYRAPLERLTASFYTGGICLALVIGMTVIGRDLPRGLGWQAVFSIRHTAHLDLALILVSFFGLGLLMLGQVHYALLQRHWQADGTPTEQTMAGRWARVSLAFITVAGSLALLLPTGYSGRFLYLLSLAVGWLLAVLSFLLSLLLYAFGALFSVLLSLLTGQASDVSSLPQPAWEPPRVPPEVSGVTPDWVLWMRTILFWALIIAGTAYVVVSYLRDHPELVQLLARSRPWRRLRALVVHLRQRLKRLRWTVRDGVQRLASRSRPRTPASRQPFHLFRLSTREPRERVLYYYRSVLERARRVELGRRPELTPREYQAWLAPRLADGEQALAELTEAFQEAQYSQHPIGREWERNVRRQWQTMRATLIAQRTAKTRQGEK